MELEVPLSSSAEGEYRILLGCDRGAIARSRMEMPVLESREALVVDVGAKALQHGGVDDLSALVNRDLDDFIARRIRQLPGIDHRIRSRGRKGWANFVPVELAPGQRSVGKSGLCAVTHRRECLCLGIVLGLGFG